MTDFTEVKKEFSQAKISYFVVPRPAGEIMFSHEKEMMSNGARQLIKKGLRKQNDKFRIQLAYVPEEFNCLPCVQGKLNSLHQALWDFVPKTHRLSQMSILVSLPGCETQECHTDYLC